MIIDPVFLAFDVPKELVPKIWGLIFITISFIGQTVVNLFQESEQYKQDRRNKNPIYDDYIRKKQSKDPNKKIGFPIPFPNKPKDSDDPDKKDDQDPVSDDNPKGKPDPNNDDAPKTDFKRNLDPNPDPSPPPIPGPVTTPNPPPISVKNPPYFKRTGKFIYQPLEQYKVNVWSMPLVAPGDSNFSPLIQAQSQANKTTEYLEFLGDSRLTNDIGKYKISDLLPVIMSPGGIIDANPTLIVGTEAIGKFAEAYENYSDAYLSNPIFFVPSEIQVNIIEGLTNKKRRLPPDFDQNFKPINEVIPEAILDLNLFKIPKEVTMERLLEFAGHAATFEGGAEKWEQYKKDPSVLKDPNFFVVPTSTDILNETSDGLPQYQKQNLKIESLTELLLVTAGTIYTKTGLHEFPSENLPGVKNPEPMPEPDPNNPNPQNNQNDKSNTGVVIGSLAGGLAYMANWFNFKIGDFPAEVEIPDPANPEKTTKEKVDVSGALTNLLTLGGITVALQNFGNNVNMRNAAEIEATKNAAQKGAECSCINMANSGMNTRPKAKCNDGSFNFTSAKGFSEMLSKTKRCYQGAENQDNTTIKAMLENIMFGVNIIKSAFFRGEKELENQEAVLKDLLSGKINDDDLNDFIKKFNDQKTPLTKDYPVKAKIVKKDNSGGTP
ncbi:hypothetical protein VKI21_12500 [Cyanobacterium aponinum UTEX 3222]|uniref:hypothetical protein n=1 Tax=Cyanobacterium aponinum TaxID=379064 RepID=UPI00308F16F3|nr:hypothetical protein VKI21_12500 [Cyanobacterium aponinum UTEX 3222]